MGNEFRRRLLGGHEVDIRCAKCRHTIHCAKCIRYAKRTVNRRERREEREQLRDPDRLS